LNDAKQITRTILLVSADNYTAWNIRKKIITLDLDNGTNPNTMLDDEVTFMNLVNSKHPKSGESWEHRNWVLRTLLFNTSKPTTLSHSEITSTQLILY
jgi:protein prenyltransferase alpha subunit repeat containing protein 1